MGEDQVRPKVLAKVKKIFQDFLASIWKYPCGERSQDDLFLWYTQHRHGLVVFIPHIFQIRVGPVIRQRDAQDVRSTRNVMQERAASQLDVVRVRAKEQDSFAEEIHRALFIQHCVGAHRKRTKSFYLDGCSMEAKSLIRERVKPTHVFADWDLVSKQCGVNRAGSVCCVINVVGVDSYECRTCLHKKFCRIFGEKSVAFKVLVR